MAIANSKTEILPPPSERSTVYAWIYNNLFGSWLNTVLTIVVSALVYVLVSGFIVWAFGAAEWEVITNSLRLILVGQYPSQIQGQTDLVWRIWLSVYLLAVSAGLMWGSHSKGRQTAGTSLIFGIVAVSFLPLLYAVFPKGEQFKVLAIGDAWGTTGNGLLIAIIGAAAFSLGRWKPEKLKSISRILLFIYLPIVIFFIRGSGNIDYLESSASFAYVPSRLWGGLLLSLMLAVFGILFSFPIGVTFALWRQSKLKVLQTIAVLYIELIRGVPLISLLFMAQVMLPLFLPDKIGNWSVNIDQYLRAQVAVTLFSAAYLAENIRGGLQSIPKGQHEAAHALGLNGFQSMTFIILPQALRAVIPVMVGQFIGLFKDTTLVSLVGLLDLLGMARSVMSNPNYLGTQREVFLFISLFYFIFSYAISSSSRRLETSIAAGAH